MIGDTGTDMETDNNDDDVALTNKNIDIVFHRYWHVIFIMEFIEDHPTRHKKTSVNQLGNKIPIEESSSCIFLYEI